MKAQRWLFRNKQDVVLETFQYDEKNLGSREVAVRVDFTVISPGTECANYLALDPDVFVPGRWCAYPWVPGYAGVGHVIAVGPAVTEYKPGDVVVGFTRHASHFTCDADLHLAPLDPRIPLEQAPFLRILSITATPLQLIHQDMFPTVGVWGLGMIGNLTAQCLQRSGGRVVGMDPLPQRRALATRCGIRETLDPTAPDFADQVKALTAGLGFDITVDTTGHAPTTIAMPSFTRPRGQLVIMTHWRSQPVLDAAPFLYQVFIKGITVHGAHELVPGADPDVNAQAQRRRKWRKLQHEMATGGVQVAPLISHRVRPHQAREAYEGLCFDRANWWGAIVDWRD